MTRWRRLSAPDLTHPAFADLGGDGVRAETGTWTQRHGGLESWLIIPRQPWSQARSPPPQRLPLLPGRPSQGFEQLALLTPVSAGVRIAGRNGAASPVEVGLERLDFVIGRLPKHLPTSSVTGVGCCRDSANMPRLY